MKTYYIYILTNQAHGTLYVGVTGSLKTRLDQHFSKDTQSFSKKYQLDRLVYLEKTESIEIAIQREKQLKNWRRQWKINLIESMDPTWQDLARKYRMDAETSSA